MTEKQKEDWYWDLEGVIKDLKTGYLDEDIITILEKIQFEIFHSEEI